MFRRKHQHYDPAPGPQGPTGPKGDMGSTGPMGRDWTDSTATWSPVATPGGPVTPEPTAAHDTDAGVDLQTVNDVVLPPHSVVDAHTGWTVNLQPNTVGMVAPRSGLSGRGVTVINAPGIVDSGYTGEIVVRLHNTTDKRVVIAAYTRVAQFLVIPVVPPTKFSTITPRGARGLGSTGDGPQHWVENDNGVSPEAVERVQDAAADMVDHPPHYTDHAIFSGECWDNLRHLTPAQYAAGKYLWRWDAKDDAAQNLRKALWYLRAGLEAGRDTDTVPIRLPDLEPTRYLLRDLELTEAENAVLEAPEDDLYSTVELRCAMAYLAVLSGDLEDAIRSTEAALDDVQT